MTMEWNNKSDQFDSNGGNGNGSFEQHNECMREFRGSHADIALVNGPRLDKAAYLDSLLYLRVNYTMETGGSALPDDTSDQSPLVPIWRVARYKLSQN